MAGTSTFGLPLLDPRENLLNFVFLACIILLTFIYLYSRKTNKSPPVCKGWIPWLGCAIELGKRPLDFIEEKRKEVYTILILHLWCTHCLSTLTINFVG